MLTRRRFVSSSAMASAFLASPPLLRSAFGQTPEGSGEHPLRLAIIGSTYALGSRMQTLGDRFLVGYPREGDWHMPAMKVVSMYVDRRIRDAEARQNEFAKAMQGEHLAPAGPGGRGGPANARGRESVPPHSEAAESDRSDLSEVRAQQFGFRLSRNIPDALRCGGNHLAVDAVLCIVEQDDYPLNDRQAILLPTYDFFQQCVQVFEDEKRAVPYFSYGPLSFSLPEAHSMVETATRLNFPLLAGSALPVTWRLPAIDLPMGANVQEAVMVGIGSLDRADFDALEAMQSMLERRRGGETGVKAVQLLEGDDVWAAGHSGRWSGELLSSALSRSDTPLGLTLLDGRTQDLVASGVLPQLVKNPAAYCVEYTDGTRATLLMLNGAVRDFNISLRVGGSGAPLATQFFLPPAPNQTWSACLAEKIEHLCQTRTAPYPVQRSLLTSGILEASLQSRHQLNQRLETPHLAISYHPPAESQFVRT